MKYCYCGEPLVNYKKRIDKDGFVWEVYRCVGGHTVRKYVGHR
jgi:hypothetical protein